MVRLYCRLIGDSMTGTNQIYARHFRSPRASGYIPKEVAKDPSLGVRLDKVLKEPLDNSTKQFVGSLKSWFDKQGGLTQNQLSSFQRIESRFSPGEKAKLNEWRKEYLEHHVTDATILANYYLTAGYWTDMASHILNSEGYIPPKHKYRKMSSNKYALNVLHNFKSDAQFDTGAMVQLRQTVGRSHDTRHLYPFKNRLAFVIDNNLSVLSATKGGKRYNILPLGHNNPLTVEERYLMKPNKKGKSS